MLFLKLAAPLRWILVALLALAAAALLWRLTRPAPPAPLPVSSGEIELRVAGPGTVQARVPVTVSARVAAQVVSLHADHGEKLAALDLSLIHI